MYKGPLTAMERRQIVGPTAARGAKEAGLCVLDAGERCHGAGSVRGAVEYFPYVKQYIVLIGLENAPPSPLSPRPSFFPFPFPFLLLLFPSLVLFPYFWPYRLPGYFPVSGCLNR